MAAGVFLGLLLPVRVGLEVGEELRPPCAWFTPGLSLRSVSEPRQAMMSTMVALVGVVVGGVGRHDAVAVEPRPGEDAGRVGRVLDA